jgi:AraC-like DNA-binding protein
MKRVRERSERRVRLVRHELAGSVLTLAKRAPDPRSAGWIDACYGYEERAAGAVVRSEFANTRVVVILETGDPIEVGEAGESARNRGGFVAGIHGGPTRTAHAGQQSGVELLLSPLAARRILGVPLSEIAGRVLAASDVLPGAARALPRRLAELASWAEQLDAVDDFLASALRAAPPTRTRELAWAIAQIERRAGAVRIAALARELGWSERRLERGFTEHVGVAPKLFARIARFEALMARVNSGAHRSWAEAALALGYADQSHLVRDVRQFSGLAPTAAEAQLLAVGRPEAA